MLLAAILRTSSNRTSLTKQVVSSLFYSTKPSSTSNISKKSSSDIITIESDFAFRKRKILELDPIEQDKRYYPVLNDVLCTFKESSAQLERIPQFRSKFDKFFKLNNDIRTVHDEIYIINGKIKSIRRSGKGSIFLDIIQDFTKLQVLLNHKMMKLSKDEFHELHSNFRPGDLVTCIGSPGITNVGELSLKATSPLKLVAPSLHPLPPKFTDTSKINSNRVIDYLVNKKSQDVILVKSKTISIIRRFFEDRDFIEIATPIIGTGNTGANATPFITHSVHLKDSGSGKLVDLSLRVAPELWLKKLIISGFDKIFEIGQVFRNEGVDATHNPEFTSCEFYQTFINLDELMNLTEMLFTEILIELLKNEKYAISHSRCNELLKELEVNNNHFKKIDFIPELEKQTGVTLPDELTSANLLKYHEIIGLKPSEVKSEAQLLDNLSSTYLEPLCQLCPTFIYNLPEVLSPLAKSSSSSASKHHISNRFEMYINGKEIANAYEEENNPFKQLSKFQDQLRSQNEFNDLESIIPDYKFVETMEWGMPPTGGWGLGIDRLVMLLTETERIDSVLPFGKLPDVLRQ